MSAAVGAALKKILVAILTDPKVLKRLLFAIAVVLGALILPTVFVVSIFSGDFQVDTAALHQYVEDNLSSADIRFLSNVENTIPASVMASSMAAMVFSTLDRKRISALDRLSSTYWCRAAAST